MMDGVEWKDGLMHKRMAITPYISGLNVFMHMLAYDRACLQDTHVHIVES